MKVGVLSVQGAFAEMKAYWRAQGAEVFEIRKLADLERGMDILALPGGESTVQGKLLKDLRLFAPLKERIDGGIPVFAVCAGLIRRNAYGRQLGSFKTVGAFDGRANVPMTFIRAPTITAISPEVKILSTFTGSPTAVRWRNITAVTWHPELNVADA